MIKKLSGPPMDEALIDRLPGTPSPRPVASGRAPRSRRTRPSRSRSPGDDDPSDPADVDISALVAEIQRACPLLGAADQEAWDRQFFAGPWHFVAPLRAWASLVLGADPWAAEALLRGLPVPRRRLALDALRALGETAAGGDLVLAGPEALRLELHLPAGKEAVA